MKVAIVSTIQPETHYTRYLYRELKKILPKIYLLIDKTKENFVYKKESSDENIKLSWNTGFTLPVSIMKAVNKVDVNIVHLQHEFNMYGGINGVPGFLFSCLLLKLNGKKIIVTIHAVVGRDQINLDFLKTMALSKFEVILPLIKLSFSLFYFLIGKIADGFIVHSNFSKNQLVNDYRFDSKKVSVIPIGIEKPNLAKSSGIRRDLLLKVEDKKYLLFFGYLLRRKGLDLLIKAFFQISKKHGDYVLVLGGGTLESQKDYQQSLVVLVKKLKLEKKVIFTDFLSEAEIDYLYKNCKCVVLPYTHSISSSLPLSFAFEYGKPVVGSDIGTLAEEIKDEDNGLIFKSESLADLSKQILRVIENKTLFEKLTSGAIKEAKIRSWKSVAETTKKLYLSLNA